MFQNQKMWLICQMMASVLSLVFMPAQAGDFMPPKTVLIEAGPFIAGSDRAEREAAYRLDEEAYGHSATRKGNWYENELDRHQVILPAYAITRNLITNAAYARFIANTGHRAPGVHARTWAGYGLIHPFERTQKFSWHGPTPPKGRGLHPVVLVSQDDARAYARWLSNKTGQLWRLPGENEWEKAVRGIDGQRYPWGNDFNASRLNSHDQGPFDTLPVGSFPAGASDFGVLDGGGQVFEWTSEEAGKHRYVVKGGSWDDKGCGVCRPAARHSRPGTLKHILIGFRLVRELN